MSASVCLAQVDDARGDTRSALKYWAKAAKLGHPEAQFRLGRVRLSAIITSLPGLPEQGALCGLITGGSDSAHKPVAPELAGSVCPIWSMQHCFCGHMWPNLTSLKGSFVTDACMSRASHPQGAVVWQLPSMSVLVARPKSAGESDIRICCRHAMREWESLQMQRMPCCGWVEQQELCWPKI